MNVHKVPKDRQKFSVSFKSRWRFQLQCCSRKTTGYFGIVHKKESWKLDEEHSDYLIDTEETSCSQRKVNIRQAQNFFNKNYFGASQTANTGSTHKASFYNYSILYESKLLIVCKSNSDPKFSRTP